MLESLLLLISTFVTIVASLLTGTVLFIGALVVADWTSEKVNMIFNKEHKHG